MGFAKWRSPLVIDVTQGCPSELAIRANMHDLARYALICQSEGLMPIVEPDISLSGSHTLEQAIQMDIKVQAELFKAMIDHNVYMAGTTLKPNIVNPGRECTESYTVEEIAAANIFVFEQSFPDAAARLSAINQYAQASDTNYPWNLSFSWSAAIQLPVLNLCENSNGKLLLDDMSKLYIEELQIA